MNKKYILDACCGSRMFWFDKTNPNVLFMDIRDEEFDIYDKHVSVHPDIIADFRNMPFENEQFSLVVFDPPHLRWAGQKSIMKAQYGQLTDTWETDIKRGFKECFRVLRKHGTLIFKWSEAQIPIKEVLKLTDVKPLFGNKRGTTHWLVFTKEGY